ncbi:hypothetical protein [Streptomyces sp. NPDC050704]|uniref:hypothetical protein n=1 Tax=Streptomyces sp. NPDC050704 TaxID=3157219 RepID=UPI0034149F0A
MAVTPKSEQGLPVCGWRMDPIPSRPAYKGDDGSVRIPIWLTKNGRHIADVEMVLLPSEAELLADRLAKAMGSSRSILHELFRESATALAPGVVLVPKDGPSWT